MMALIIEGAASETKMSAESRTLAPQSPTRLMYFEARITRISYTLGRSCDPLANYNFTNFVFHRKTKKINTKNREINLFEKYKLGKLVVNRHAIICSSNGNKISFEKKKFKRNKILEFYPYPASKQVG